MRQISKATSARITVGVGVGVCVLVGAGFVGACSSSSDGAVTSDGGRADASTEDASIESSATEPDVGVDVDAAGIDAVEASVVLEAGPDGCPSDGGIPDDLSCTGLYSDWTAKTIATDAVAFTPALVFWSDGAVKSRWIYMPAGSSIDTTDMDDWVFPIGTKIWKTFDLNGQIVETRLIWKTTSQDWTYLDYRWSSDGSSARRLDDGETNVNGTSYEIPATSLCAECHGGRKDVVLGFDLVGLGLDGAQGVTLATLAAKGVFTHAPSPLTIAIPEDATKKAAAALGWLHVNCGSTCHNANGKASGTRLYEKLLANELYPPDGGPARVAALDAYVTAVKVAANLQPNGVTYERIAPGDSAHSLVSLMASSRDAGAGGGGFKPMPPIVSHISDDAGVALVNAWIDALGDAAAP